MVGYTKQIKVQMSIAGKTHYFASVQDEELADLIVEMIKKLKARATEEEELTGDAIVEFIKENLEVTYLRYDLLYKKYGKESASSFFAWVFTKIQKYPDVPAYKRLKEYTFPVLCVDTMYLIRQDHIKNNTDRTLGAFMFHVRDGEAAELAFDAIEKYQKEKDGFVADVYCLNRCSLGAKEFRYGQKCKLELNPVRIDGIEVNVIDLEQNFCNMKPKMPKDRRLKTIKPRYMESDCEFEGKNGKITYCVMQQCGRTEDVLMWTEDKEKAKAYRVNVDRWLQNAKDEKIDFCDIIEFINLCRQTEEELGGK